MLRSRLRLAAACGLILSTLAARAQSPTETVVVTAARVAQPLSRALADLSVIDRETIEAAGSGDLPTLLQRLAGVEIAASGGAGQVSGLYLRGSNANHVVLLIDGVRVNSATAGTNAFEHLPLALIERIEVLRGPASGLYGADAIGGVIQVFTRREVGTQLQAETGSARTRAVDAYLGRRNGDTRWSMQVGARSGDDRSATNDTHPFSYNPDRDPYRNVHAGGELAHRWSAGHELTVRLHHADARAHFDAGPGADDVNHQQLSTLALESRDRVSDRWRSLLRAARGRDDSVGEGSFPSRFRTEQDQLAWQNDVDTGVGTVAAGLEWRRERVSSDTAFTRTARRIASAFAGISGEGDAHGWQLALRHDRNSQFGDQTTGNAGWGWRFAPGWRLSTAAGTAFKAPSFNDLYYPLQFGYAGNPELKPERSHSIEAGLRHGHGPHELGLTAYTQRIRDLIVINADFSSVDNIAEALVRGLALDARTRLGAWTAALRWTHQRARDGASGARLPRRADDFGSAGLEWAAGAWRAGATWTGAGARVDSGGAPLAGYGRLDLHAAWDATPALRLTLRVDNATDRDYTLVQGYDVPRRGVFAGATVVLD